MTTIDIAPSGTAAVNEWGATMKHITRAIVIAKEVAAPEVTRLHIEQAMCEDGKLYPYHLLYLSCTGTSLLGWDVEEEVLLTERVPIYSTRPPDIKTVQQAAALAWLVHTRRMGDGPRKPAPLGDELEVHHHYGPSVVEPCSDISVKGGHHKMPLATLKPIYT